DGPADVGDVDRQEAAPAQVSQGEGDRQTDRRRDQEGGHAEEQLLHEQGPDPLRALPVGRVGQVLPGLVGVAHDALLWVHGVIVHCAPTMTASSTTATTTHKTPAARSSALKSFATPSAIRLPRPPYPTSVPTVVRATVETVATRSPAIITGSASGS